MPRARFTKQHAAALAGGLGLLALALLFYHSLAGLVFTLLGLCTHRTFGGWQFGARYTMDLVPWALLFFLRHPPAEPGPGARWLCAAGVLFNFYGAVYLLSH